MKGNKKWGCFGTALALVAFSIAASPALAQIAGSAQDPAADRDPASPAGIVLGADDLLDLKPIMPPPPRAVPIAVNPRDAEVYDLQQGKSFVLAAPAAPAEAAGESRAQPYQGLLPQSEAAASVSPETVIGVDDRVQITNTGDYPWRTVVFISITFPTGSGSCSGAVIDNFHVLTAGHCVHDGTAWATSLIVYPARSGSTTPYNKAYATYLRSYTGWTVDQNHEHDWAVVTLDRNIGAFTGWMGRITRGCSWPYLNGFGCDSLYFGGWNNAGYPDRAPDGTAGAARMYFDYDNGLKANDNNHWYYNDTRPGNSGSPMWVLLDSNRYIGTVHAYGDDGSGANHGTRLNQDKFDRIISWVAADTAPTDRPDLVDDGAAYFYGSPTTVIRGVTSMSVGSDVRNLGTTTASNFINRYVLSTNTSISTTDYTLCEATVSSVAPFTWAHSDCSGVVPAAVPPGNYYLGVIYDVYNSKAEFDEGNNTAYRTPLYTVQALYTLTVNKSGSGSGTVTSSPAGINCGVDCSENYMQNTSVTLTAAPAAGSVFTGWSGSCSGTGSCTVSMTAARTVTATFQAKYTLSVLKAGTGTGTVVSTPAGISCGADCTEDYIHGTSVTLTATPDAGMSFAGWSGACSGTGACALSMTSVKTATATFNKVTAELASFTLKNSLIAGCKSVAGTLTLTQPAPAGGFKVTITDTLPSATPPATVTIAEGLLTKNFTVKSTAVGTNQSGTVTAKGQVAAFSQPLTLRPMGMLSVALLPNPVVGGQPVSGTAKLECAAGPGAITAALASTIPGVANPAVASITFPVGTQVLPFNVTTTPVAVVTKPKITAKANGILKSKTLTVNP